MVPKKESVCGVNEFFVGGDVGGRVSEGERVLWSIVSGIDRSRHTYRNDTVVPRGGGFLAVDSAPAAAVASPRAM